jgi:hypothetical protein
VDDARRGHSLKVVGICHGSTVIEQSILLVGKRTRQSGRSILDGEGKVKHVLRVKEGVRVTIRDLTIEGGKVRNLLGAGILNRGSLKMRDVVVRLNKAGNGGGGIYNEGRLVVQGASRIKSNRGPGSGGLLNAGIAWMSDTVTIRDNRGGGVVNRGTLVLNDASSIRDNIGPGVMNGQEAHDWQGPPAAYGSLTLNDESSISGNSGSAVWNANGSLVMTGSSTLRDNLGSSPGGGVYNAPHGTVTLTRMSSIQGNRGQFAGGVYNLGGSLTMTDSSSIHDNHASSSLGAGGLWSHGNNLVGVYCAPQMYANVYGNTPSDCSFE